MESGTVLHLALLKKLSNHYPDGELTSKYHHFKQNFATRCSPRPPKQPAIQKYEPYGKSKPFEAVYKPRRCRMERKFQKVFEDCQFTDSLTAWNVDNQQQVSYTEKLKRDKYDFFPKLIEVQKKNRNKIKYKMENSSKEMFEISNKAHNFLVQQINKTPTSFLIKKDKLSPGLKSRKESRSEDKQNIIQLQLIVTGYKKARRAKSNDRFISVSPLAKNMSNTLSVKD